MQFAIHRVAYRSDDPQRGKIFQKLSGGYVVWVRKACMASPPSLHAQAEILQLTKTSGTSGIAEQVQEKGRRNS